MPPIRRDLDSARRDRQLKLRMRLAWLAGVEARSRRENGRASTNDELREALRWYSGDLPER